MNERQGATMAGAMAGKVCVVTGATSGIGMVTARALAAEGAAVTVIGRNQAKAEATIAALKSATGNANVEYALADFSSLAQVRRMAGEIAQRHPKVDVLVNNAGGLFTRRQTSMEGYEITFAVNHLAPFLLTNLLLENIKAAAPSRIVTVGSIAHANASTSDLNAPERRQYSGFYGAFQAYAASKLANIMFAYALARRLQGSGVTSNTLHPGVIASSFMDNNGAIFRLAFRLARGGIPGLLLTTEQGAQTSIYVASSPEVANLTGKYFVRCKPVRSSAASYDEAAQERLWTLSEQLTGLAVTV